MKLRLALRILWGLCCLLLLWVAVADSIQFSKHPEFYPIGCEGLSWSYESSENYILTGWVAIGWSAIGFVASACYRLYSHLWIDPSARPRKRWSWQGICR